MARSKKPKPVPPPESHPPAPSWKTPGEESAVVYEDELPWNHDKGICFQIKERRGRLASEAVRFLWVIELGGQKFQYERTVSWWDADEAYIDRLRKEARLDMLYRAHRAGVI